ncbi:hypothetical protein [Sphingomonas sp.]|uniref:hypothetical protein n=1 Tax=Sphingomonas sp. TaxID=28214 RepID=UPI002ED857CD
MVNIITRNAADTQGVLAEAHAGSFERVAGLRYGATAGDTLSYPIYARGIKGDRTRTNAAAWDQDERWRVQGGFRVDWTPAELDRLTLQGDAYQGSRGQIRADERIIGRNLLARWNRGGSGSHFQVQGYCDRTTRVTLDGGGRFDLDTYDLDLQHGFTLAAATGS